MVRGQPATVLTGHGERVACGEIDGATRLGVSNSSGVVMRVSRRG
jgi:hypothetical protein